MPGIIDSFFVALGYKIDNAGLDEMKRKAESAKESMLAIGGAIAGIVSGFAIHKIAEIGSTFEQNRIQIAGFLSALEISSDFNAGLKDADATIQSITAAAARLPGEAEEYIDVFKTGLSFVQGAMPGASLKQMTDFTNQLKAIGKSMALPADQIGREMMEILAPDKGNAQKRNRLFIEFLPLMRKLQGQAHLTAESFNEMTAPQRAGLLQQTFVKMKPMLDAAADSFDAMWGAAVSGAKQLLRIGTAGLFKGMKEALDRLNAMFVDSNGNLTDLGQRVAGVAKTVSSFIADTVTWMAKLTSWFVKSGIGAIALKSGLGIIGTLLTGLAAEKAAGGLLKLVGSFKNLKAILTGGLVGALLLIAQDLYVFSQGGVSVTGMLKDKLGPAFGLVVAGIGILGAALVALRISMGLSALGMATSWAVAFWPVFLAIGALAAVGFAAYELYKHWDEIVANMKQGWLDFVAALKSGPHDIKVALGFGTKEESDQRAATQRTQWTRVSDKILPPGADVIWRNPSTHLEEMHPQGWQPPQDMQPPSASTGMPQAMQQPSASMTGAQALARGGGGDGSTSTINSNNKVSTTIGNVEIKTNDPAVMRREFEKMIRDGNSQVLY